MRMANRRTSYLSAACFALLLCPISSHAWEPNTRDLKEAISTGDFGEYYTNATIWLDQKTPDTITEDTLKKLLDDARFVTALDQHRFISTCGLAPLGAFAKTDKANRTFLTWLLQDSDVMDLYLEAAAVPTGGDWGRVHNPAGGVTTGRRFPEPRARRRSQQEAIARHCLFCDTPRFLGL